MWGARQNGVWRMRESECRRRANWGAADQAARMSEIVLQVLIYTPEVVSSEYISPEDPLHRAPPSRRVGASDASYFDWALYSVGSI